MAWLVKVLKLCLKFWAVKVGVWFGAVWWGQGFEVCCEVCVRSSSVVCEACCRSRCLAVVKFVVCELRNEVGI